MMRLAKLREQVCHANRLLDSTGLVVLTWGNASGSDRNEGVMAIKPSGIDYASLQPEDMVLVDIESGRKVDGDLNPSSDTATHLALYRASASMGGVVHTHSCYATIWAQSCKEIPCLGTTHADQFYGPVPLTRELTDSEIEEAYEANIGNVIVEHIRSHKTNIHHVPAILVPHHGPFVWGRDCAGAVQSAIALEEVAKMAAHTVRLNPEARMPAKLLDKHFLRKHGPDAYYEQED